MRYYYEKTEFITNVYGELYRCDHPVYDICTLYKIGNKGLAVIQQRYSAKTKHTWWSDIDSYLIDVIYLNNNFKKFFDSRADLSQDDLYPTVTLRQIMWALKMKPLKRERWETVFDKKDI